MAQLSAFIFSIHPPMRLPALDKVKKSLLMMRGGFENDAVRWFSAARNSSRLIPASVIGDK